MIYFVITDPAKKSGSWCARRFVHEYAVSILKEGLPETEAAPWWQVDGPSIGTEDQWIIHNLYTHYTHIQVHIVYGS
jgi:hypothetical protein